MCISKYYLRFHYSSFNLVVNLVWKTTKPHCVSQLLRINCFLLDAYHLSYYYMQDMLVVFRIVDHRMIYILHDDSKLNLLDFVPFIQKYDV